MNCKTFLENSTDLLMPGTPPEQRAALAAHARECPACAAYLAGLQATRAALRPSREITASSDFKERVMKKIEETNPAIRPASGHRFFWKPALAAALLIALGIAVFSFYTTRGGNQAFALEKLLETARSVRFIHMLSEPWAGDHVKDIWAQFDDKGNLLKMRSDFPDNPSDGPKIVLWQEGKAQVWFKRKNVLLTVDEPAILERYKMTIKDFDPRILLEGLYNRQKAGELKIQAAGTINGGVVSFLVTYKNQPDRQDVYKVTLATNQVESVEKFQLKDGKPVSLGKISFSDYNNPAVAAQFTLEVPKDMLAIDQTRPDIGLEKGTLSDKQIAAKVAQDFFTALIAGDYDKAGLLCGGINGPFLKKGLSKTPYQRIVKIGDPTPDPDKRTQALQVPCDVEVTSGSTGNLVKTQTLYIRPIYNHPNRWAISGGM